MPRNYKQLQEKITFDSIMGMFSEKFAEIFDHRRSNRSIELPDILRSAFAMFSLKSASLLSFEEQTKQEKKNLKSIYHIETIPSDTQMRTALDPIDPNSLRDVFASLYEKLRDSGVIKEYEYLKGHVIVSVDGVEHFYSTKVHCPHCTTRTNRNGETSYHHSGLDLDNKHPAQCKIGRECDARGTLSMENRE